MEVSNNPVNYKIHNCKIENLNTIFIIKKIIYFINLVNIFIFKKEKVMIFKEYALEGKMLGFNRYMSREYARKKLKNKHLSNFSFIRKKNLYTLYNKKLIICKSSEFNNKIYFSKLKYKKRTENIFNLKHKFWSAGFLILKLSLLFLGIQNFKNISKISSYKREEYYVTMLNNKIPYRNINRVYYNSSNIYMVREKNILCHNSFTKNQQNYNYESICLIRQQNILFNDLLIKNQRKHSYEQQKSIKTYQKNQKEFLYNNILQFSNNIQTNFQDKLTTYKKIKSSNSAIMRIRGGGSPKASQQRSIGSTSKGAQLSKKQTQQAVNQQVNRARNVQQTQRTSPSQPTSLSIDDSSQSQSSTTQIQPVPATEIITEVDERDNPINDLEVHSDTSSKTSDKNLKQKNKRRRTSSLLKDIKKKISKPAFMERLYELISKRHLYTTNINTTQIPEQIITGQPIVKNFTNSFLINDTQISQCTLTKLLEKNPTQDIFISVFSKNTNKMYAKFGTAKQLPLNTNYVELLYNGTKEACVSQNASTIENLQNKISKLPNHYELICTTKEKLGLEANIILKHPSINEPLLIHVSKNQQNGSVEIFFRNPINYNEKQLTNFLTDNIPKIKKILPKLQNISTKQFNLTSNFELDHFLMRNHITDYGLDIDTFQTLPIPSGLNTLRRQNHNCDSIISIPFSEDLARSAQKEFEIDSATNAFQNYLQSKKELTQQLTVLEQKKLQKTKQEMEQLNLLKQKIKTKYGNLTPLDIILLFQSYQVYAANIIALIANYDTRFLVDVDFVTSQVQNKWSLKNDVNNNRTFLNCATMVKNLRHYSREILENLLYKDNIYSFGNEISADTTLQANEKLSHIIEILQNYTNFSNNIISILSLNNANLCEVESLKIITSTTINLLENFVQQSIREPMNDISLLDKKDYVKQLSNIRKKNKLIKIKTSEKLDTTLNEIQEIVNDQKLYKSAYVGPKPAEVRDKVFINDMVKNNEIFIREKILKQASSIQQWMDL